MDYMTLKEAGEKWGVTPRWINYYCSSGRHSRRCENGNCLANSKEHQKSPLMVEQKKQGAIAMENKIILIEDDEEIRSMVKDYLSGEFQVLPFSEGKTAIHTVKNYDEYSLALIDLMLPDMSGMEIIKTIRQVSTIPIIIITAKDNDTDKSLGAEFGGRRLCCKAIFSD